MKKTFKMKSIGKDIVVILLITISLLFLLEGISSFIFFFRQLGNQQIIAERIHTEYDPLLGWINKPNLYIRDMYSKGKYLRTNSQRFRNNQEFDIAVPTGKRRWICSGDSFTLGYGVDNDNSWCNLLTSIISDIESVNMGQGGYGIDQSFLWYMRDGIKLQHDVLVFAFITDDFDRMANCQFLNYPKPCLGILNGQIIKKNVPVPRPGFLMRYFPRYQQAIELLRTTWLIRKFFDKLGYNAIRIQSELSSPDDKELPELIFSIITTLYNFNKRFERTVLLVHLPIQGDYKSNYSDPFRSFLNFHAEKNNWFYIDLIDDFRKLDSQSVPELFIQKDIPGFIGSRGHYTEKGNRYIADLIVKKITSNPSIAKLVPTLK